MRYADQHTSPTRMSIETIAAHVWLLLAADEDENKTPVHGVKLAFHAIAGGIRGAIVNWRNGDEIPLASLSFDGSRLELQMTPDEHYRGEILTLKMSLVGGQFEGYWTNSANEKSRG